VLQRDELLSLNASKWLELSEGGPGLGEEKGNRGQRGRVTKRKGLRSMGSRTAKPVQGRCSLVHSIAAFKEPRDGRNGVGESDGVVTGSEELDIRRGGKCQESKVSDGREFTRHKRRQNKTEIG